MPTELNPTNAFGELLLDLIDAQYGDLDAGVQALVDSTGLSEEEVVAIVNGDTIVEDENLLASIIDAFPDADEDDLDVIINVADGVDQEDRQALESSLGEDETTGMEEEDMASESAMPAEEPEAEYSNASNVANFMTQNETRLADLEQTLASFQYTNTVKTALKQIEFAASEAVSNNILPASLKKLLIGDFKDDDKRLARFSQIAAENNVDVPTMIFATEFALSILENAAPFVEFQDYSVSDEEAAVATFSASLDSVVKEDLGAIFGSTDLIRQ
jgi:hypothetical protein